MNNFFRALKEARRFWPALVGAFCCSLGVATLWGANIAALFPIIETTLRGESLQAWNQHRIERSAENLETHQAELEATRVSLEDAPPGSARADLELKADLLATRVRLDRAALDSARGLHPYMEAYLPDKPFHTVALVIGLVLVGTCFRVLFMIGNTVLVSYVSQSIARTVRSAVFDHALALDRAGYQATGTSGFAAQITHTTDMLAGGITSFYGGAITEPLRVVACLAGAWFISWRLTLASMIFAPLAGYLMLGLNRKVRGLAFRMLDRSLGFHHIMLEVFGAVQTVQAYTMEGFERERFGKATGHMRRIAVRSAFYKSLAHPVTELLGMGMLCSGLCVSSYLVLNQETHIFGIPMSDEPLTVAAVTVFFGMLIGAADPLRKLSAVIDGVNTGMAAANLLYPLIDRPSLLVEPANPAPLPQRHTKIELRNVTFSYDGVHDVLHNVNLTINAGDRIGVVGPNGGGKSTLINLLCRFYDPRQGEVLLDGVPLPQYSIPQLRGRIALVTQQTELFNETIMHNIRYGRWDASESEVYEAARLARAHDFVSSFTEGYQTIVGDNGQRLSGGQRQRVALARAFLRNAEILILDEATSQIDAESERLIHEALAEYGRDRTVIFITHRESTLSLATRIVRLEYGYMTELPAAATAAA